MRSVAIIQARMTSTRLPGKVLMPFGAGSVLRRVVERVAVTPGLDAVCVAVPDGSVHDPVAEEAGRIGQTIVCRGSENDVLDRYARAADTCGADYVLRVTSDCPVISPDVCGMVLNMATSTDGYARTSFTSGYPLGLDCEAMPVGLLMTADREAKAPDEREHVTPFLWRHPDRFPRAELTRQPDRREWRLTLDEQADYDALIAMDAALGDRAPIATFEDLERLLLSTPDLLTINAGVMHKPVRPTSDA
ncbi:MAG: glycosyltransferase family protein [Alphaproteobacteria bacterium]